MTKAYLFSGVAVAVMTLAGVAQAETVSTPATAQAQDDQSSVDDIIVTAQRRRERLEDVPAAVAVVSGETLTNSGVVRFQDLGNVAPGVQIARTGVVVQPSIRGISSGVVGFGQENNIAVYIDGFYQPDAYSINQDFANLADVQILKGPQGTLYGRNATGGAILVNTLDPGQNFDARASVSYGSRSDIRAQAYVAGPLTDTLAFGLAAYRRSNDGYIHDLNNFGSQAALANPDLYQRTDNNTAPFRGNTVRAKLKWTPNDVLNVTLGYSHLYVDDARALAYTLTGRSTTAAAATRFTGLPTSYQRDVSSLNYRPYNNTHGDDFTLTAQLNLGDLGEVTSRTSYVTRKNHQRYDFDGTPFDASSNDVYQQRQAFTQAIDASLTPWDGFDFLIGAFYYDDDSTLSPQLAYSRNTTTNALGAPSVQTGQLDTQAYAVYADGTWALTDRLTVTAGLRYSSEDKHVARENPIGRDLIAAAGLPPETTWDGVTARLVARYNLGERSNVYASFSQGFKSGTYATSGTSSVVDQETIDAYEIGYKLGGPIRFEAAAFRYNYRDLQTGATIFVNGLSGQVLFNVPEATVDGAEFNFAASPIEGLDLRIGAAYTKARYGDFPNATGTGLNTTTGFNISGQIQDWTGLRLLRSPDWTATAAADYRFDLFGGTAFLTANANYTSEYTPSTDSVFPLGSTNLRYLQPAYTMVSASASWTDPTDRWTVGIFAENLTNKRYKIVANGSAFGDYDIYNEPRTVGVRLSFRY